MKILYPLLCIILLLADCDIKTGDNGNPPPPSPPPIYPADYKTYILPDKPSSNPDMPKFEEKAALGKVLFFTKINGSACADCHSPNHGFTAGQQQSCGRGCEGMPPNRRPVGTDKDTPPVKSPSSIGVVGSKSLLWTGLAGSEKGPMKGLVHPAIGQALLATSVKAHNMILETERIKTQHPEIFEKFKNIYPDVVEAKLCEPIDVAECLAAFQMRLVPNDSRFQQWLKGEEKLPEDALRGLKAFSTKCASCHKPPYLGSDEFYNVGFPHLVNDIHDGTDKVNEGRHVVTKNTEDMGKFRTMRLATNVASHIRWGHGATFDSLDDCIKGHQNIKEISEAEIGNIIEFLNMTTDRNLLNVKPEGSL